MKYQRILLKLSGEALMGNKSHGIDPERIDSYAKEIKKVFDAKTEIAIVIGGGNIFRGISGASKGMDRVQADYMGMLATVINGLALQGALENNKVPTRLQTAIKIEAIARTFYQKESNTTSRKRQSRHFWIGNRKSVFHYRFCRCPESH